MSDIADIDSSRWMDYDSIAKARGVDRETIVRLARRKRWARRASNAGTALVLVPEGFLQGNPREGRRPVAREASREGIYRKVSALEAKLDAANERISQLEARNDQLVEQNAKLREARAAAEALAEERAAALNWLTRRRWWQFRRTR